VASKDNELIFSLLHKTFISNKSLQGIYFIVTKSTIIYQDTGNIEKLASYITTN